MKYLILLLIIPVYAFALVPANKAKAMTADAVQENSERQIKKFQASIETTVNDAIDAGLCETAVGYDEIPSKVIEAQKQKLVKLGYSITMHQNLELKLGRIQISWCK